MITTHRPNRTRRRLLQATAYSLGLASIGGCRNMIPAIPRIVIIGGGYGGATAARYLSQWAAGPVSVTMIVSANQYFSCPGSNRFIAGFGPCFIDTYHALSQRGVKIYKGYAKTIDRDAKTVRLSNGDTISYDRLIAAPGIAFDSDPFPAAGTLAAWSGNKETYQLAQRINAIEDGQTIVITIPLAPFKCPAAPYERACLIARRIQLNRRRAQVIVLDENTDIVSKSELFHAAFHTHYADVLQYWPETPVLNIDSTGKIITPFDTFSATIINRIPPQRASLLLQTAGLIPQGETWCPIDWQTMRSQADPHIYVIGDATQSAPELPKSAHVANNQAKICASAVLRDLANLPPYPEPVAMNCCFSYVSESTAIHQAGISRYSRTTHTMKPIPSAFSISSHPSAAEATLTQSWLTTIRQDAFG